VFPPEIAGYVRLKDLLNTPIDKNLKNYLKANPDIGIVRLSGRTNNTLETTVGQNIVDLSRDQKQYLRRADTPNFYLIDVYDRSGNQLLLKSNERIVQELQNAIKQQIGEGRRVILDRTSLGSDNYAYNIPSGLLDIGRKVSVDRAYTDTQRNQLLGKYYGTVDPQNGAVKLFGSLSNKRLEQMSSSNSFSEAAPYADYYAGLKDVGANVLMPNGNDIMEEVLHQVKYADDVANDSPYKLERNVPMEERAGRKLGLFNGAEYKVKGTALNNGKGGALNRLNKYIGKDVTKLSAEEQNDIVTKVEEFIKQEFASTKDTDAVVDAVLNAVDPLALQDMERGVWADIARNHGELGRRASKAFYFTQVLSKAAEIANNQNKGAVRKWTDLWGWFAKQSTMDMVRLHASDAKIYNGMTPIYDIADVSLSSQGTVIRNTPVPLHKTYDDLMPRMASLESGTALRHSYRYRYLNGLKDAMGGAITRWREDHEKLFPEGTVFDAPTLEAAKAYLRGNGTPFSKSEDIPLAMASDETGAMLPVAGGERTMLCQLSMLY
jgi:hypothetical protein